MMAGIHKSHLKMNMYLRNSFMMPSLTSPFAETTGNRGALGAAPGFPAEAEAAHAP